MKTISIMMDSLNRHYLPCYGGDFLKTPNIDRLAARGVVFDNHYCGSLPCIPARREMMTGRYNFLEAPWGPIEPWDECLPTLLRHDAGTYSHMVTDHYHYFRSGGEGYHTLFDSWEFERGQEGDQWRPLVTPGAPPQATRSKAMIRRAYWANRRYLDTEDDAAYSTPRTFQRAIDFLEANRGAENWHLRVEAFDPHEPFDCPTHYCELYGDEWEGSVFTWPDYAPLDPDKDDERAVAHIRACYGGTATMADAWLGKLLDKLDELGLWKDTTVVFTTDHGHLLGEHGYWAKNYMMDFQELVHIPLIVCPAGRDEAGRRVSALTGTIDLAPTLLDMHGVLAPEHAHGRSMRPLIDGSDGGHHDALLYGYFGKDINLTDGRYTYCRQPLPDSTVHHQTAMPRGFWDFLDIEDLVRSETGPFLKWCHRIPHLRIPRKSHRHHGATDSNPIYDVVEDPGQTQPLRDAALEARLASRMRDLLIEADAPECQFDRMGFERP